ncbi:acyltransferase family protein [Sessilibacter sp. MAH2]
MADAATRDYWVDYAKAIGIALVVYGHVIRGVYDAGLSISEGFFLLSDSIVYSFHMPLFFFLSGLFFFGSFNKRGAKDFLLNKVDTVAYPYFLWSFIQITFVVVLARFANSPADSGAFWSILTHPFGQFWFLYALFFFFVASSIVFFKEFRFSFILILLFSLAIFLRPLPSNWGILAIFFSSYFCFFLLGAGFKRLTNTHWLGDLKVTLALAMAFIVFQGFYHFELNKTFAERTAWSLALTLVSMLFVVSLSMCLARKPKKWVLFVGASSMAIYVMHILTGSGIRVILQKIFGIDDVIVHVLLGFAFGMLVPMLAQYLIDRYKIPLVFSAPISVLFTSNK